MSRFLFCCGNATAVVALEPSKQRIDAENLPDMARSSSSSSSEHASRHRTTSSSSSGSTSTATPGDGAVDVKDGGAAHVTIDGAMASDKPTYFDVQLRTGGLHPDVHVIAVHEKLKVDDLHRQVAKLLGEQLQSIRLIFKSKVLSNRPTETVGAFGIQADDVLQLIVVSAALSSRMFLYRRHCADAQRPLFLSLSLSLSLCVCVCLSPLLSGTRPEYQ